MLFKIHAKPYNKAFFSERITSKPIPSSPLKTVSTKMMAKTLLPYLKNPKDKLNI